MAKAYLHDIHSWIPNWTNCFFVWLPVFGSDRIGTSHWSNYYGAHELRISMFWSVGKLKTFLYVFVGVKLNAPTASFIYVVILYMLHIYYNLFKIMVELALIVFGCFPTFPNFYACVQSARQKDGKWFHHKKMFVAPIWSIAWRFFGAVVWLMIRLRSNCTFYERFSLFFGSKSSGILLFFLYFETFNIWRQSSQYLFQVGKGINSKLALG